MDAQNDGLSNNYLFSNIWLFGSNWRIYGKFQGGNTFADLEGKHILRGDMSILKANDRGSGKTKSLHTDSPQEPISLLSIYLLHNLLVRILDPVYPTRKSIYYIIYNTIVSKHCVPNACFSPIISTLR